MFGNPFCILYVICIWKAVRSAEPYSERSPVYYDFGQIDVRVAVH